MRFIIFKWTSDALIPAWEGTPDDDTAPLAFVADMREFGPRMAVGDRLSLNAFHFAEKVA